MASRATLLQACPSVEGKGVASQHSQRCAEIETVASAFVFLIRPILRHAEDRGLVPWESKHSEACKIVIRHLCQRTQAQLAPWDRTSGLCIISVLFFQ
jgi:hypothetical protein